MTDIARDHALDATIAATASKGTYFGAGSAFIGWVTSSEFGILVGIVIGVGGFFVNWYYKAKEDRRRAAQDRREIAEHRARMKEITGNSIPGDPA